jgi:autotransporter-associated beta strand protein
MRTRQFGWIASAVLSLSAAGQAVAATITWDGGVGGTGTNWNEAVNWSADAKPGAGDTAEFRWAVNPGVATTIALGAPQTVGVLSFATSGNEPTLLIGNAADAAAGHVLTVMRGVFRGDNMGNWQTLVADVALPVDTDWDVRPGYNSGLAVSGALRGSGVSLAKWGGGTLALQGTNTFSGYAAVNAGTLTFDFNAAAAPTTNIWSPSAPLQLKGCVINLAAKQTAGSRSAQTLERLSLVKGSSRATLSAFWNSGLVRLNLGGFSRNTGATLMLVQPSGNTAITASNSYGTTNANDGTGLLGAYLTVAVQGTAEASDWACNTGTLITNYTAYADLAGAGPAISDAPSANVRVTGGSTGDVGLGASSVTVNTLAMTDSAARTLVVGPGNTLRLGPVGGILTPSAAGPLTISGGTLTAGGADGAPGEIIFQNARAVTNSAAIADNAGGAVALTKSGGGALVLTSAASHTGGTYVNAGRLVLPGGANPLVTDSLLEVSGGVLDLGGGTQTNTGVLTVRGGAVTNGTLVRLGSDVDAQAGILSASLGGDSGLRKTTPGTLYLMGANTYTGDTVVLEGALVAGSGNSATVAVKGNLIVGSPDGILAASVTTSGGKPFTEAKSFTVYGNGSLSFGPAAQSLSGRLTLLGGSFTGTQPYFQNGSSVFMTGGTLGGTLYGSGSFAITSFSNAAPAVVSAGIRDNNHAFNVARGSGPVDLAFTGSMFANTTLTKTGAGVMTMNNSFHSNGTVVAGGTLLVNGTNAFASVTVSANSGATLGGAGLVGGASGYTNANVTLAGSTNLAGGATLFPGTVDASTGEHVIGTFTVGGPAQANHVTFGAYSTLRITVSTNGACDRLVVYGTLSLATATDRLAIVQAEAGELPAGTYSLASFQQLAAEGQTFDTVTGLPERGKLVYSSTGIELVVTAPPPKGTVLSLF